tara:strand:- start:2120 stop:3148 length:1029 start_codon:yes stop_codon:yes gene_type:complete
MDSWKDILKISPTEKETAQRSETWTKEVNDLKAEALNNWGELEWVSQLGVMGGYWGMESIGGGVEVVVINMKNLTIRDTFEEISPNEVKNIIKYIDTEDLFERHEGEYKFTNDFLSNYEGSSINDSVQTLILNLHRTPQLVERFSHFSKGIDNYSGIDNTRFKYDMGKIQYRFEASMQAQATIWKEFINFKYLEKDLKEFNVPSNRAALFADGIVSSSPNMTNITVDEIKIELEEYHIYHEEDVVLYHSIGRYLARGQENAWVKVITNKDNVYYVNTKTPAMQGEDCRIMLFGVNQVQYCVMTSSKGRHMPYGDHIATMLMMISDEKGTREKGDWDDIMQVL